MAINQYVLSSYYITLDQHALNSWLYSNKLTHFKLILHNNRSTCFLNSRYITMSHHVLHEFSTCGCLQQICTISQYSQPLCYLSIPSETAVKLI